MLKAKKAKPLVMPKPALPLLPKPTSSPTPSPSPVASPSLRPTPSPRPTLTPKPTATQKPAAKPTPSATAGASPKTSASPKATPNPKWTPGKTLPPVPSSEIKSYSSEEMKKKAAYSLIVQVGQRFEIPMSGTAWTYIGARGSNDEGIRYETRRYEASRVFFAYDPRLEGEYLLEFVRQDLLIDEAETLYVRILVEPKDGSEANPSPQAGLKASASPHGQAATPGPAPSSAAEATPAPAPSDDLSLLDGAALLAKAGKDLEGSPDKAQAALSEYLSRYQENDEWLWLAARAYEAPGPKRDILLSRKYYARIRDGYPESKYSGQAEAKVEYIDRRYLEIR
jgi:hypothetical protein